MPLWDNSIYRFRVPVDANDPAEFREVVFDVTQSAPTFDEPSQNFRSTITDLIDPQNHYGINSIIEFGAAKLKNIPYLLGLGKTVCAVEFESITENSVCQENLTACREYGNQFQELLFPNPFLEDNKRFDLAILANVLPVMPIPAERLYVLKALHEKLHADKYLLWIAQKEGSYKPIREAGRNNFGDGVWMGKGRRFKTFYRYHSPPELDEMMSLFGFKLLKRYPAGDDTRLYVKTRHTVMNTLLTPELLARYFENDPSIADPISGNFRTVRDQDARIIEPNPSDLAIENLYIRRLSELDPGLDNAEIYHRLTANAIARIFKGSLGNMQLKVDIGEGIKEIDTVFTNIASNGFFHTLPQQIAAPYPMFEMKNYTDDPENNQFDQLNGRFNDQRGHFGVLVCRHATERTARLRCRTYLPNNYVIYLTDEDLIELLEYRKINDEEAINDFMDAKLRRLLF